MKVKTVALLFLGSSAALASPEGSFEKSMPVPHGGDAKIGWSHEGCSVLSLTVRNFPGRGHRHGPAREAGRQVVGLVTIRARIERK